MKCALELTTIKAIADEKERLRQLELDKIAKIEYDEAIRRTQNFCENISDILEDKAMNRKPIEYRFRFVSTIDRLGNKLANFLYEDGMCYANGTASYNYDTKEPIVFNFMVEFLNKYCYRVFTRQDEYKHYGFGTHYCTEVIIRI